MFGTLKKEYDINGYAIVRNVIDPELVSEVEDQTSKPKWFDGTLNGALVLIATTFLLYLLII